MWTSIPSPQRTHRTPAALIKANRIGKLYLYLAISDKAISVALGREEEKEQWPVYYVSKRLLDTKTRYPELEKLALALMVASKKLRPYFHSHPIKVLTNYPLRQVLQKPEASGRLLKWVIELWQFDVKFRPWMVIKWQALADFIAEFTYSNVTEVTGTTNSAEAAKVAGERDRKDSVPTKRDVEQWTLYVDSASNDNGFRVGMMLISPEGHKIHCAIRFVFKASNNKAEYEALITGLRLVCELQARNVKIFSDSQLVVN